MKVNPRDNENLAWNLAVCECLVLGSCKPDTFSMELAAPALIAVNDFVKNNKRKISFLRKKKEFAENQLSSANCRISTLRNHMDIMLDQRLNDCEEIEYLKKQLEDENGQLRKLLNDANTRIIELLIRISRGS